MQLWLLTILYIVMYKHIFLVYNILFVQSKSFEDTSLRYLCIGNMKESNFSGLFSVLICLIEYCQMRIFLQAYCQQ